MDNISFLSDRWIQLKEQERQATEARREIEDQLYELVNNKPDGSATTNHDGFVIKVTRRMNRKIDADLLQEIAAEHGTTEQLSTLFRWKPDIDMRAWKSADESITKPMLDAITTSEGRASFSISKKG